MVGRETADQHQLCFEMCWHLSLQFAKSMHKVILDDLDCNANVSIGDIDSRNLLFLLSRHTLLPSFNFTIGMSAHRLIMKKVIIKQLVIQVLI